MKSLLCGTVGCRRRSCGPDNEERKNPYRRDEIIYHHAASVTAQFGFPFRPAFTMQLFTPVAWPVMVLNGPVPPTPHHPCLHAFFFFIRFL